VIVDDQALIAGTLAGRNEDFEVLVERHQRLLYAFVFRQIRDQDAADEIVQETFVLAYRNLGRYRGEASFKTWLHQIALNQCRARFRQHRGRREIALEDVPEVVLGSSAADPSHDPINLERHIARLPPRQRAVLTLRIFSDLSFKEIGTIEGISENSAKVSFHHAIVRLKQWLRGDP